MPRPHWWLLPALAVATALPCAAQGAARLNPTAPRVFADDVVTIKGDDGAEVTFRATLTYDPVSGDFVSERTDVQTGVVIEREVFAPGMMPPSATEEAEVQALIATDAELSALVAAAPRAVTVAGGFPLVREPGHRCDATARCVQYDLFMPRIVGPRGADRLRYVVVDLRTLTLVDRDFDPATEGNLANPQYRDESRSR